MKSLALFICLSLLLGACSMPQVIVKHQLESGQKLRVAILPFRDAPGAPGSGEAATDAITPHLLKIEPYEIIERGELEQILKEQKLGVSGALEQENTVKIGKLLGADFVIIGAVTEYQKRNYFIFPPAKATVNARMVKVETGTVEWSGSHTLGWHPIKWITSFFWPLAVIYFFTSPSAQDRLTKASKGIADTVRKKSLPNQAGAKSGPSY